MRVDAVLVLFVMVDAGCFAYRYESERTLNASRYADLDHAIRSFVLSHKEEWLVLAKHVSVDNSAVLDIIQDGCSYACFGISITSLKLSTRLIKLLLPCDTSCGSSLKFKREKMSRKGTNHIAKR